MYELPDGTQSRFKYEESPVLRVKDRADVKVDTM